MALKKISEKNLIEFLQVIIKYDNEITLQDFIEKVKNAFYLSEEDLKKSKTRPNEAMYVQRCRNLISHKSFPKDKIVYENQTFKRIRKLKIKRIK